MPPSYCGGIVGQSSFFMKKVFSETGTISSKTSLFAEICYDLAIIAKYY
jgi:hypothetical protein